MSRYHVDSTEVAAAAARTAAAAVVIREEVAAMSGRLATLQETWGGGAALAFAGCAEQWRAAQSQVEAALEQISVALESAAGTYADAEAQAQAYFGR